MIKTTFLACLLAFATLGLCDDKLWCNRGTAGDGSCEHGGYHTFCCKPTYDKNGGYVNHKRVKSAPYSFDPKGLTSKCGAIVNGEREGSIECAS